MFGGAGIFDIISNPVDKAPEDIAQAGLPEASEVQEALSWEEVTIENDGFPTTSTPQDRDSYWAGPRGPKDAPGAGLDLKQPSERRARGPAREQSFRCESSMVVPYLDTVSSLNVHGSSKSPAAVLPTLKLFLAWLLLVQLESLAIS